MSHNNRRWFANEEEEETQRDRLQSPFRAKRDVHALSLSDNSEKRLKVNSSCDLNSTISSIENLSVDELSFLENAEQTSAKSSTPKTMDPTNPSNKDIMAALAAMTNKLNHISNSVDEVKGEIHVLKIQNETLKKEVAELKREKEAMQSKMIELEYSTRLVMKKADENAQYSRINNLRWHGVKEVKGENLHQRFVDMVTDKLSIHDFKVDDIEAIHRLGSYRKKSDAPRPVIVRLRRRMRDEIMSHKKNLAKTGMSLMEDLTKTNLQLYNRIKNHPMVKSAWTNHGKILISVKDSEKIVRVSSMEYLVQNIEEWSKWVKPQPKPDKAEEAMTYSDGEGDDGGEGNE